MLEIIFNFMVNPCLFYPIRLKLIKTVVKRIYRFFFQDLVLQLEVNLSGCEMKIRFDSSVEVFYRKGVIDLHG